MSVTTRKITKLIQRSQRPENSGSSAISWLIPAFSLIFALATTTMANNQFIGFAPIGVMVALAFGFDAVVGCGMICLGGAIGFSTGTFNVNTTGIAQEIAELPLFSGLLPHLYCLSVNHT